MGNINYTNSFLKELAKSKNVDIELNQHDGQKLGKIKSLEAKDNALYATMEIPEEHLNDKIAFSTDCIPSKYTKIDSNTFEPTAGLLNAVVYVNDGTSVRDKRTITALRNLEDNNMAGDETTAQQLGALQTKYDLLLADNTKLQGDFDTLKTQKDDLETQLSDKTSELQTANDSLKTFEDAVELEKTELIKTLVKDDKDPKNEIYKKLTVQEIQALANAPENQNTPPKGAGTRVVENNEGEGEGEGENKGEYDYQGAKKAMNLR